MGRADAPMPIADAAPTARAASSNENAPGDPAQTNDPTANQHGPKTDADWATENVKRRDEASAFWSADPFWMIVICRVVLQPLYCLQQAYLKRAGPRWELKQQAKVARCCNQGVATEHSREYRALLAAESKDENVCMDSIRFLFSGIPPWQYYFDTVPRALTVRGRALAFRMASRAGCSLEEMLLLPHRGYPWKTLRMRRDPSLAEEIDKDGRDTTCKGGYMDEWSKGIWTQFPSVEQLKSNACMAVLLLALLLAWVCTGTLESLHASVRRMIQRVQQTHMREFGDVQCAWVTQAARRIRNTVAHAQGLLEPTVRPKEANPKREKKEARSPSDPRTSQTSNPPWWGRLARFREETIAWI